MQKDVVKAARRFSLVITTLTIFCALTSFSPARADSCLPPGVKAVWDLSKDHNFHSGETVEKQIIIINNSREKVTCDCFWSFELPEAEKGRRKVIVETGEQERIPLRYALPATLVPGEYTLKMKVKFSSGDSQEDCFTIHVLPQAPSVKPLAKIALFDPKGETRRLLGHIGVKCDSVDTNTELSPYNILIVGKGALTLEKPAPHIGRVPVGLKVLIFEQGSLITRECTT